jgi:hypothetical protein
LCDGSKVVVYSVAAGLECRDWTSKGNAFVVACDLDRSRGSLGREIGEICSWEWHLFTHGRQNIIHRQEMPDSNISRKTGLE